MVLHLISNSFHYVIMILFFSFFIGTYGINYTIFFKGWITSKVMNRRNYHNKRVILMSVEGCMQKRPAYILYQTALYIVQRCLRTPLCVLGNLWNILVAEIIHWSWDKIVAVALKHSQTPLFFGNTPQISLCPLITAWTNSWHLSSLYLDSALHRKLIALI